METIKLEIRNDAVHITGYINVVERDSRVLNNPRGKFIEQVKAKTFQRALESTDNVDLLYNHDNNRKLGSIKEGNLELWEDEIGLRANVVISDPEVVEQARNKKLTGWSFGFQVIKDRWFDNADGIQRRILEEIRLLEVSILTGTPAYLAMSLEARDDASTIAEFRNVEVEETEVEESDADDAVTNDTNTEDTKTDTDELDNTSTDDPDDDEETRSESIDYSVYDLDLYILKNKYSR